MSASARRETPTKGPAAQVDVAAYLKRIGYEGSLEPTAETLAGLHAAHRLTVPYENLDVTLRRPMVHTPQGIFEKIVGRRRGGWCHELNRLFAALLEALDFRLTYHNAKVWQTYGGISPDFSHLVLVVHMEQPSTNNEYSRSESAGVREWPGRGAAGAQGVRGRGEGERWIADVGFGARGPLEPLRLDTEEPQPSAGDLYRVGPDPEDDDRRMVFWQPGGSAGGGDWLPMYSMALATRQLEAFDARCAEQQTEENWWSRRVASIATPEGRVSLNHDRLIVTRNGTRDERLLADDAAVRAALKESFGIDLD